MKNYISINGQKIELTDKQIDEIKSSFGVPVVRLRDVKPGGTVKIGDHEMVVLEHSKDTTAMIRKDLLKKQTFGDNNNYNGSNVDATCNKFAEEIAAIVGEKNVIEHTVDLTSDDGLKDYGSIRRKASLLTADLYRRYVQILDTCKPSAWWWLATPYSTPTHENSTWIKCVAPAGDFYFGSYYYGSGVRPFCILNSDIFVSN